MLEKVSDESTDSGEEDDEEDKEELMQRQPRIKPMSDMSNWVQGVQSLEPNHESLPDYVPEAPTIHLPSHEDFVYRSEAYMWLVTTIRQHWELAPSRTEEPSLKDKISTWVRNVVRSTQSTRHLSRRRAQPRLNLDITADDWDPVKVAKSHGFTYPLTDALEELHCLTGSWGKAQVTTVTEYINQTWPVTGKVVLSLLHKVLADPEGIGKWQMRISQFILRQMLQTK